MLPPEWEIWRTRDKAAYVVSVILFLGLAALGVLKLKDLLGW